MLKLCSLLNTSCHSPGLTVSLSWPQASRWTYSSDTALSPNRKIRANVIQRYHFSSNLRRMTATIEVSTLTAQQRQRACTGPLGLAGLQAWSRVTA